MTNKILLAFSGGLDTSFCVRYLQKDKGYEVHTATVQTGGFSSEELEAIEAQAYKLGAVSHTTLDCTHDYYERVIRFLVFGNVLRHQTYPLSVSAERMSQALALAEHAQKHGFTALAHGSTGAGNDQVRFDLVFQALLPEAEILTPIRELRLSRAEEVAYLAADGITFDAQKAAYSINQGLWGTSVGGVETLNSLGSLPESAWPTPVTATEPVTMVLSFKQGELVGLNDQHFTHPVDAIRALQALAAPYGIGRDIHVGDTIIGIKGRVGFEAAAPVLIIKAHLALEKHVLSKWQLQWKEQVGSFYGNFVHEGLYLDPVMRDLEALLLSSQQRVTGKVHLRLHPYRFEVLGIESDFDLMAPEFGSYGEMNRGWTGADVAGFTRIYGNQIRMHAQLGRKTEGKL
ncbi:MAG: argininosuccinate synthase [Sphingobacteriaceae bacterium]|nr:argininosuccinate synthase [Sphingobacteriaceae bacterium]